MIEELAADQPARRGPAGPTNHLVLVVDDEPASVRAVCRTLRGEARLLTAGDGRQAWEVLEAQPVCLVVADQRMPDMSGTELLARTAQRFPEVVRVLLTGYTDTGTLLEAINAGHVYAYLTKPWSATELLLAVRRGLERYDHLVERRRLHAELEKAVERLRREVEWKNRLLTLAAHELGTPLHLIGSALELLAAGGVEAALAPWLAMAQRNVDWLARGLSQMLAAGRWRSGPLPLRRTSTAAQQIVDTVRARFAAAENVRQLHWTWQVDPGLPLMDADPEWLARALGNLVSNAIRFTPDGGAICVRATHLDDTICIAVTDTGIGIDASLHGEIFEPFAAASGDLLRHGSGLWEFGARGLGLGLAIAKAVVDQHGGELSVVSRTGQGSCFTIRLPVDHAARP
jgi:signal transduction histidine kinase